MKLKHFQDQSAVLDYVFDELLATLRDDLDRMTYDEPAFYSDEERQEMADRIEDIEAVRELEGL